MQTEATDLKLKDISKAIMDYIKDYSTLLDFNRDHITDEVFRCFPASPQAAIYRAILHGTINTSSSDIILLVSQWITAGASIVVRQVQFRVDSNCAVTIPYINFVLECPEVEATTVTNSSPMEPTFLSNIIIPGAIAGGIITIVAFCIVLITMPALMLRKRCTGTKHQQSRWVLMT